MIANRHWSERPAARALAWVLLIAAIGCLVEVGLIVIAGGEWNRVVHARCPLPRLAYAGLCWFGWYYLRHGARNTPRQWAEFAGRLVLATFSTLLSLFVAEVGLRFFLSAAQNAQSIERLGKGGQPVPRRKVKSVHPLAAIVHRSADPKLIYELLPNLDMEFGHKRLRPNSQGMRDSREYAVERKPNSVRIIGLGDSGMFGWEVEQNEDYMSVIESNLNRRADGVVYEVLNMAVPGYNTQLEVECLRYKGLKFKPDIVIVGWCDNDFQMPFFVPQKGQWSRRDVSFLYYLLFDRQKYADTVLSEQTQVRELGRADADQIPEDVREGVKEEGVRQAFGDLKKLGRQNDFRILVFGPMRPEAVQICRELGIECFNTRERIPKEKYPREYLVHFIHPRPGGHRVLAEYLEQELQRRGRITPRARPAVPAA
jgi:hypothetical protein